MKSVESLPKMTISGRRFTRKQLTRVQETVQTFNNLSRQELALTICEHLDWRTPAGSLKVQSGLTLLEELDGHGVITLPPKRITKAPVRRVPAFDQHPACPPVEGSLSSVAPILLRPVTTSEDRERWKAYLQTHHYLGYKHPFGASLGYFIVSEPRQQELGCFVFTASASWALAPRDQWIGWDEKHRKKLLSLILSNDRFLIFPWVKVPHLASHVLSLATNRIADDWVRVHGYRPVLIETFVDPTRYSGTCYQAANWEHLGQTQGRGRDDPHHEYPETKKDIYVYPLRADWQDCLTQGHRKADIKKRYRNDLASARTRSVGDHFVTLWKQVAEILNDVASEYDRKWRVRKRVIDSLMLMLLIFRLVSSKNSQSYGTTIDDLWDSCDRLDLSLPQKSSIAPSSFCEARKKLNESIFQRVNTLIIETYASERSRFTWRGHRLFAIDGSKITLPRTLLKYGYRLPNKEAHYPQGLLSCLYEIRTQLPFNFDLVARSGERSCAAKHLQLLQKDDVVVYDRGYFSYLMLHQHFQSGVHAIFRLQKGGLSEVESFLASNETDKIITIFPSEGVRANIRKEHPDLDIISLKMRLIKYEVQGSQYCLGTTLVDPKHCYPLQDFMDVYHSRWGVEELYKISKRIFLIEDFHAKTERGVKQELFAHFVLITMNRLFANQADLELNSSDPTSQCLDSSENNSALGVTPRVQTNFKNCIHVLERNLEELLLLTSRIKTVIHRTFDAIVRRYQRVRPERSFPRKSMKPDPRWQLSSRKKKKLREAAAADIPA
ncbi:MAG: IS4 family transposase [Gammaproteobacteria bacterium]|nr:MAG: IS4 family transposase [Gammaproteobacteria bacterium]